MITSRLDEEIGRFTTHLLVGVGMKKYWHLGSQKEVNESEEKKETLRYLLLFDTVGYQPASRTLHAGVGIWQ